MATPLTELHTINEIRGELCRLRDEVGPGGRPAGRTSVLTLVAWAPPRWQQAADQTLDGLAQEHPSRVILLMPAADRADERSGQARPAWSARVGLRVLDGPAGHVAAEVIRIDLAAAATTAAAASIVLPLVRSDLPVFLRWRGPLPDDTEPFGSLLGVADRLIVDAREWPDPDAGYARLRAVFDQIASSDISWRRLEPWRRAIAACRRPGASFTKVRVGGPAFEARLLAAWLTARLGADIVLEHREADRVTEVALDGEAVRTPRLLGQDASELLSCELDQLAPDPIFEEAVCALSSVRI